MKKRHSLPQYQLRRKNLFWKPFSSHLLRSYWKWLDLHDILFFFSLYLFIWLYQVWDVGEESRIFAAAYRIFSWGTWDLVPHPGIKPRPPLAWETGLRLGARSLSHRTTRKVPHAILKPTASKGQDHGNWLRPFGGPERRQNLGTQAGLCPQEESGKGRVRSDQIRSVTQLCPTLCDPMNHSTPGLPVHHQLPEFTETHVHRVSDAIQPSHPLSSLSPLAPNPSQHQSLFQWVNSSHEVAKVLEFQL